MDDGIDGIDQVVPGGWRRAVIGLVLGAVAGMVIGLLLPRDEERRWDPGPAPGDWSDPHEPERDRTA